MCIASIRTVQKIPSPSANSLQRCSFFFRSPAQVSTCSRRSFFESSSYCGSLRFNASWARVERIGVLSIREEVSVTKVFVDGANLRSNSH